MLDATYLRDCCRFGQGTFVGASVNDEDAPLPDTPRGASLICKLTEGSRWTWLSEAALSVNAGGGSKQKMRWGEDGREGQIEALSKR